MIPVKLMSSTDPNASTVTTQAYKDAFDPSKKDNWSVNQAALDYYNALIASGAAGSTAQSVNQPAQAQPQASAKPETKTEIPGYLKAILIGAAAFIAFRFLKGAKK